MYKRLTDKLIISRQSCLHQKTHELLQFPDKAISSNNTMVGKQQLFCAFHVNSIKVLLCNCIEKHFRKCKNHCIFITFIYCYTFRRTTSSCYLIDPPPPAKKRKLCNTSCFCISRLELNNEVLCKIMSQCIISMGYQALFNVL